MESRVERSPDSARGRHHRLPLDEALQDLCRRYRLLQSMYDALVSAQDADVARSWQNFFTSYDDFLEAARDVRSRFAQEQADITENAPPGHAGRSPDD